MKLLLPYIFRRLFWSHDPCSALGSWLTLLTNMYTDLNLQCFEGLEQYSCLKLLKLKTIK